MNMYSTSTGHSTHTNRNFIAVRDVKEERNAHAPTWKSRGRPSGLRSCTRPGIEKARKSILSMSETSSSEYLEGSLPFPVVVLPGFGNNTEDYVAPFGQADVSLVSLLEQRGIPCRVLDVKRKDWFSVGKMIFTKSYWKGTATTKEGYAWYLDRARGLIASTCEEYDVEKVVLLGHSAGGWLGRALIGDPIWRNNSMEGEIRSEDSVSESGDWGEPHGSVAALVTLGTPHVPPCPTTGKKDMTGGALTWVNETWPGAYFSSHGIAYVSVASKAVRGDKDARRGSLQSYACNAYAEVLGTGHDVEGDAVVPLESSLLVSEPIHILQTFLSRASNI